MWPVLFPEHLVNFLSQDYRIHGFFQVIGRPQADGLYCGLDIGIPGHDEYSAVRRGFPDPF